MNQKLTNLWATKTKDDEWWSSFVTAPIAILLNYLVVDIKMLTPNRITLCSFIIAISSVIFITFGGKLNFIIAAILIQLSHIMDCMDGQMARYRKTSSLTGSFFDKLTDQIQIILWFTAISYAAYHQTGNVLPIFLAFIGVAFYNLRGYAKYVSLYTEISNHYNETKNQYQQPHANKNEKIAGLGFGFIANLCWFLKEQQKILYFDEGVFIFMLSFSLIINQLTPMLWIFAITQIYYGLLHGWKRGHQIENKKNSEIKK